MQSENQNDKITSPRERGKTTDRNTEVNMKYVCSICGYTYDEDKGDPDNGIDPGTLWDDLPDDFTCPECGVGKEDFESDIDE